VGARIYRHECGACHGRQGEGGRAQGVPMLAGQYTSYLWRQVGKYVAKERIHDPDAPDEAFLSTFSHDELRDVFAYLSAADD